MSDFARSKASAVKAAEVWFGAGLITSFAGAEVTLREMEG